MKLIKISPLMLISLYFSLGGEARTKCQCTENCEDAATKRLCRHRRPWNSIQAKSTGIAFAACGDVSQYLWSSTRMFL